MGEQTVFLQAAVLFKLAMDISYHSEQFYSEMLKLIKQRKALFQYCFSVDPYSAFKDLSFTCVLCQITDALECPSLFRQGPLS